MSVKSKRQRNALIKLNNPKKTRLRTASKRIPIKDNTLRVRIAEVFGDVLAKVK